MTPLDYTIQSPEERTALVQKIVDEAQEPLSTSALETLANYIIFAMDKKERLQNKILTDNHMITVNRHETSYQGLASKFENGEDGLSNLIIPNDKNIIFSPKVSITAEDIETIPGMKQLREAIELTEEQYNAATGRRKYLLRKQLIELRQDQYTLKNSYRPTTYFLNVVKSFNSISFDDVIKKDESGVPHLESIISFSNPKHISALLCNYSQLKEESYGKFWTDAYYLMEDLDGLVDRTLKDNYPFLYSLLIYKIDGKSNAEIKDLLEAEHGQTHSVEYLSSLWRNKIPKLIAAQAEKEFLEWYYTEVERGSWKRCSLCGQIKLRHSLFFSKNNTSKDGYYSQCKECRNNKNKEGVKKNGDSRKINVLKMRPYNGRN